MKRFIVAILATSLCGCACGYASRPDGTRVFVGSILKDTAIGEVDVRHPDGSEFHLRGYDAKSQAEAFGKAVADGLKLWWLVP